MVSEITIGDVFEIITGDRDSSPVTFVRGRLNIFQLLRFDFLCLASMVKMGHWAHALFWEKRPAHQDHRFCKVCWPDEDELPEAGDWAEALASGRPVRSLYGGCVKNLNSPSSMGNHFIDTAKKCAEHAKHLPAEGRSGRAACDSSVANKVVDEGKIRDWALDMNLHDLLPVRLIDSAGASHFLDKYVVGMCGRTKMQKVIEDVIDDIKADVKEDVQAAKASGAKFCVQGDTWKPKMKRRTHYLAVLLTWVSKDWKIEERCIHVKDMPNPRNHITYQAAFEEALANVGLTKTDFICTVSDHEGSIRKGLRGLDVPTVGCGCHAFQLPVKHVVPPLRAQKKKGGGEQVLASDSDSDSDTSASAAGSGPEEDAAQAPVPLDHSDERQALIKHYTALITKVRAIVKWYTHHEDHTNDLGEHSKQAGISFLNSMTETPARWSSSLISWIRMLENDPA